MMHVVVDIMCKIAIQFTGTYIQAYFKDIYEFYLNKSTISLVEWILSDFVLLKICLIFYILFTILLIYFKHKWYINVILW